MLLIPKNMCKQSGDSNNFIEFVDKPKKGHATFEKIVHGTTEAPRREIPIEIVWNVTKNYYFPVESETEANIPLNPYKILSDKCSSTNAEIDEFDEECSVDTCKSNLSDLYEDYKVLTKQIENYHHNHLQAVIWMCYVGLFFGTLGGGLLVYLICFLRDRNIGKTFTEPMERQKLRKAYKNRSQYARKSENNDISNQF